MDLIKEDQKLKHRRPGFSFHTSFEKHWLGGDAFKTHFLNSLTVIFPSGERFFIRSVKKVLPHITDKNLKTESLNFIKQEAQHAHEHSKLFKMLDKQGYDTKLLVSSIEKLIRQYLEPYNTEQFNLSLTAGFEHITALLSEISLSENFTKEAPKDLKELFDWHAAEEIEHRCVAFDALLEINPSYVLRILGLTYAYIILSVLVTICTSYFLYKDGLLFKKQTIASGIKMLFTQERLLLKALNIFIRYLDPNFHPSQSDIDSLADMVFSTEKYMGQFS